MKSRSSLPRNVNRADWERIYATVRQIPYGRVATYEQVAQLTSQQCTALIVHGPWPTLRPILMCLGTGSSMSWVLSVRISPPTSASTNAYLRRESGSTTTAAI